MWYDLSTRQVFTRDQMTPTLFCYFDKLIAFSKIGLTFNTLHSSDQACDRHFFIHQHYGGCANDKGWMVVIDTANANYRPCNMDKLPGKKYPYILYGADQQIVHYGKGKSKKILVCIL